jgi:D-tyrosyl-tRNA(Tyr) deacylase
VKAVVTRCSSAYVRVDGEIVGQLPSPGLMVLVGVAHDDDTTTAQKLVKKIAGLRILEGEQSAVDVRAPLLVISQFTLCGSVRKGRRPSWSAAAGAEHAEPLVRRVCELFEQLGLEVQSGQFGATMEVQSVNDGPFTILVDTADLA